MEGKNSVTAQKLTKTRSAEKSPNVETAGKTLPALLIKLVHVVQLVVNIALLATLKVF